MTINVGDIVRVQRGLHAGEGGPNGHYNRSVLKLVDAEAVDTETVTRVVAVFQSPKAPELDMSFTNASEADVWIDHLKIAFGVAVVTVTRDTTETFIRNND